MTRRVIATTIIFTAISIIALAAVGLWGIRGVGFGSWLDDGPGDLTACGANNLLFSEWPVEEDKLTSITPLGSMEPEKGAVFPIDRLLWHTKDSGAAGGDRQSARVQVLAPGNGWLVKVAEMEYWSGDKMVDRDYTVYIAPCQEVEARFYHLQALEPRVMEAAQINYQDQASYLTGGLTVRVREAKVKLKLQSGEVLGWAGGAAERRQAFDWGMVDGRRKPLAFAHASIGDSKLGYTVCPLDYYPATRQKELRAFLGDGEKTRWDEPICGRIDQDIVGSLQGRWRAEKMGQIMAEDQHVALVHDELEPQRAVISMGTSLRKSGLKAGLYYFKQKETGYVNRDFGTVTEQGKVFCYQGLQDKQGQAIQRIVLVELVDDKSIKMEARPGFSCASNNYTFSDRMTVFER